MQSGGGLDRRRFLRGGALVAGAVGAQALVHTGPAAAATSNLVYLPWVPAPVRGYDSRSSPLGPLATGATRRIGPASPPVGIVAFCFNVTVTEPTANGFLSLFAGDATWGGHSNINWFPGQTIANNAYVLLDEAGDVNVRCGGQGSTHFILDIVAALFDFSALDSAAETVRGIPAPAAIAFVDR